MADATLAVANAILKEDYLGPIRSALNTSTPVLTRLDKNTRDIAGKEAWIPVEMELSQSAGARGESDILPTPQTGTYQELKVALKNYYGTLSVTGPALRQTAKGDRGSFARIVDVEAKGLRRLLGLVLAHDFYVGQTLGTTTGATTGDATVELGTTEAERPFNMEWFFKNMLVDILDAGGSVVAGGAALTVTAVDKTLNTITVSGTPSDVAGGSVVRASTATKTVTPLEDIIADTTVAIYGVPASTFDEWEATVDTTVGAFTTSKLQQTIDKVVVRSGKMPTAIYSDYTLQRKYFETLTANPRYMVAGDARKRLDQGFSTLEYSGGGAPMPWIADRLAPAQTIYLPHEPDLQVFTPGDFEFIDIGGDVWLPDILGSSPRDVFKAVLWRDMELGAYNRNSHGKQTGVT